jgi:hypothetical protein
VPIVPGVVSFADARRIAFDLRRARFWAVRARACIGQTVSFLQIT